MRLWPGNGGHLSSDASPVFPYLNAILPGALYQAQGPSLRFRFEGHKVVYLDDTVTLQPRQMAMSGLVDGDEAIEMLARLQRLINDTWERRAEIEPSTVERKRLNPLAIYKLLPGASCRGCGEPTCMVHRPGGAGPLPPPLPRDTLPRAVGAVTGAGGTGAIRNSLTR